MRRVFLLNVSPDAHIFCADLFSIAEKPCRRRFNPTFIRDVREDVTFCAYEVQTGSVCHSHRFQISSGEDLNADGQTAFALDRLSEQCHRRHNLRPSLAAQVRNVVHIFDDDAVNAARVIKFCFILRGCGQLRHAF